MMLIEKWDNDLFRTDLNFLEMELWEDSGSYILKGTGGANSLCAHKEDDDNDNWIGGERSFNLTEEEKEIWLSTHNLRTVLFMGRD